MKDPEEKLKNALITAIKDNPSLFQLSSHYWSIQKVKPITASSVPLQKHNSKTYKFIPFYKPISKVIDISSLSQNE